MHQRSWFATGRMILTACWMLLPGDNSRAVEGPVVLRQTTPVGIVILPDGGFAFFNKDDPQRPVALPGPDGIPVALEPHFELALPPNRKPSFLLLDRGGELHEVTMVLRGSGRKPGVDRFLDLWHRRTRAGRTEWAEPRMVWQGYTGALMGFIQLSSGRILVPFGQWIGSRPQAPPAGSSVATAIYSDDQGETWEQSPARLTAPCYAGYNGANVGACEPSVTELADGRIYLLMRTQASFLYESWSADGSTWEEARPSRFPASHGPPGLVRLRDGRIVLFWNNAELPPRIDGQGVYGGRDALHAAISADEGRTWQGFREVYRDALRNQSPPHSGDRGTAYPFGAYDKQGKIVVVAGQGEGRRNFIRFDPEWLGETRQADDFSHGLDAWHAFKTFGPARGWWRDRTVGASLVDHPDKPGAKALCLRRPDEKDSDGATWNFPSGWKGRVTIRLLARQGFGGASIALGDRLFEPCDDNGERLSMFRLAIEPDGRIAGGTTLLADRWQTIELAWDLSLGQCTVLIDASREMTLPLNLPTANGICYLRVRSTADRVDPAGLLIESVDAEALDPIAPPRTPDENRAIEAQYIRTFDGLRNKPTLPHEG